FGGRVSAVHVHAGQRVKVGAVLLSFADGAGAAKPPPARASAPPAAAATPVAARTDARASASGLPPAATPAARRLARQLGVERAQVRGTGPGGRILDDDVRAAAGGRRGSAAPAAHGGRPGGGAAVPAAPAEMARPLATPTALPPLPRFEQWGPVEREPL